MAPARTRVFAPATVSIRVGVVATARWCHVPLTGRAGEPRSDAVGNDGGTVITVTSVAALLLARTRTIVRTCCRPPITLIPIAALLAPTTVVAGVTTTVATLLAPTSHLLSPTVAALIVTSAATVVTPLLAPTIVASVTPAAIVAIVPWLGLRLGLGSGSG